MLLDEDILVECNINGKDEKPDEPKVNEYIRVAIDNLLVISKTLASEVIGVTAYNDKSSFVESYNDATKPTIVANFSQVVESLYKDRKKGFSDKESVRGLIVKIVHAINQAILKPIIVKDATLLEVLSKSSQLINVFRKSGSDRYSYTRVDQLNSAFDTSIHDLHAKSSKTKSYQRARKTAAWIEYEICFRHHFFC